MTKNLTVYRILFLISSISFGLQTHASEDPKVEKKKTYSKSYPVSANDKITLNNQFGQMKLITWEKNEVKVDVDITAKADDDKRAQEILDKITIEDGKSGSGVYFKTKFGKDQWNDNDKGESKDEKREKHRNEGMEINYTVYLPGGNPLIADNQFGPMTVPDYRGEATLVSKFGSLTAGKINNGKSVSVEFGKADIAQLNGGKLNIKFSSGTVSKLTGDVDAAFEFCDKIKMNVDNDVKDLDIKNSYSTLYLDLNKNFSGNYNISTSFGEFKNKTAFAIKEQGKDDGDENHYRPKFDHKYTGTSGSGNTKVNIKSSFGEIIMGHDLVVDMSDTKHKDRDRDKDKDKDKDKGRGKTRAI
jgi:hypothetical protein